MRNYYQDKRNAETVKKYHVLPPDVRYTLEKENPRKEITQTEDVSFNNFVSIIERAKEFAKEWNKTIDDVDLDHSCYQQDYSESYSSEVHLEVKGLETDDQWRARLMERYEAVVYREEHERKEFERLSQKFNK